MILKTRRELRQHPCSPYPPNRRVTDLVLLVDDRDIVQVWPMLSRLDLPYHPIGIQHQPHQQLIMVDHLRIHFYHLHARMNVTTLSRRLNQDLSLSSAIHPHLSHPSMLSIRSLPLAQHLSLYPMAKRVLPHHRDFKQRLKWQRQCLAPTLIVNRDLRNSERDYHDKSHHQGVFDYMKMRDELMAMLLRWMWRSFHQCIDRNGRRRVKEGDPVGDHHHRVVRRQRLAGKLHRHIRITGRAA